MLPIMRYSKITCFVRTRLLAMLDRTLVTESKEYDCLESYLLALHLVSLLGLSHHDVASMKLQFLEKKSLN